MPQAKLEAIHHLNNIDLSTFLQCNDEENKFIVNSLTYCTKHKRALDYTVSTLNLCHHVWQSFTIRGTPASLWRLLGTIFFLSVVPQPNCCLSGILMHMRCTFGSSCPADVEIFALTSNTGVYSIIQASINCCLHVQHYYLF